jgi:hypothetical protein
MMRVADDGPDADTIAEAMRGQGLPVGAHYIGVPVYEYPLLAGGTVFAHARHACADRAYGAGLCPDAETILRTCIMLTINEGYTDLDLDETVQGILRSV